MTKGQTSGIRAATGKDAERGRFQEAAEAKKASTKDKDRTGAKASRTASARTKDKR
jgi:hypothetical protein